MIPLLKDNYFRHHGSGDNFSITFDPITTPFGNYFEESKIAAEEVYALKTGNLHLMYSGGVDSEYVLNVFRHLGMDITPVIIRLTPGLNDFDVKYAFDYCTSNNLKPIVIDIDFREFVESGTHYAVSRIMKCNIYHRAATAWAMGQLDGSVLCGEGEGNVVYEADTKEWGFIIEEHDYGWYNYMEALGIDGTPHFNRFTPGMLAAWLSDPYFVSLTQGKEDGHINSDTGKIRPYNRHTPFQMLPREKQHGYELIKTIPDIMQHRNMRDMKHHCMQYNGHVSLEYNLFMKDFIVNV